MSNIPRIGTSSNGTTQACAACKYQRRKCAPDCILAPYFPHNRQRQFLNVHKLFGVSNITKIIKNLDSPDQKDAAMRTIMYQSDVRANDPVGGCYRIICNLQHQIEYTKAELDIVLHQLAICRAQAHHHNHQQNPHLQLQETNETLISCEIVNADPLSFYDSMPYDYLQVQQQEEQYVVNNHHLQEDMINTWGMADSTMLLSSMNVNDKQNECDDDVKPILEIPNELRHEIKFEGEDLVEKRFVPSTHLLISS